MFTKVRALLAAAPLSVLMPVQLAAQNELPVIGNVKTEVAAGSKTVKIKYVLSDKDDKAVNVDFYVSSDNGKTFRKQTQGVSGDAGPGIAPGKKAIVWDYSSFGTSPDGAKFRIVADDGYKVPISDLVAQVDTARMRERLKKIAVIRDTATEEGRKNLESVKNLIHNGLEADNFAVKRQPVLFGNFVGENIIGKKPGTRIQDTIMVLAAAFGGEEGSPCANNNGSGAAGMMEIAEILSKYNFRHTIVAISPDYTGEEFKGSNAYVFRGGMEKFERVKGMLDLDRIGTYSDSDHTHRIEKSLEFLFPDNYKEIIAGGSKANFLRIISNEASRPLAESFKANAGKYIPGLKVHSEEFPDYGEFHIGLYSFVQFSDHIPFWYRKYPAIWLTDAREGARRNNTMEDDVNHINFRFMGDVVKTTLATLAELAVPEHSAVYESAFGSGSVAANK